MPRMSWRLINEKIIACRRVGVSCDVISCLKNLFEKTGDAMAAFALGGLSIIGVPPTCGFFSKWYLIAGGLAAGQYAYVAALIFSSLVNLVLFFRIFEIAFFEPFADHHAPHDAHGATPHAVVQEAPIQMLLPLVFTALSLVALGLYSGAMVTRLIELALPAGIV